MAALLVPLAALFGGAFDSVSRGPDAVANVIEPARVEAPERVVTVTLPTERPMTVTQPPPEPVAAPPAPIVSTNTTPVAAAPQQTIAAAPPVRCAPPGRPPAPPAAAMSVGVLPGRGEHRGAHPDRPVKCE